MAIKITRSMDTMLDWFDDQPCDCATIAHIAADTGYSRETIRNNLKQLQAGDYAEHRYEPSGEYRLISDPREESDE